MTLPVMVRQVLCNVVGMKERLFNQPTNMCTLSAVEDACPFAAGLDKTTEAQFGQVLRNRGRLSTDPIRQLVDGILPFEQRPKDP